MITTLTTRYGEVHMHVARADLVILQTWSPGDGGAKWIEVKGNKLSVRLHLFKDAEGLWSFDPDGLKPGRRYPDVLSDVANTTVARASRILIFADLAVDFLLWHETAVAQSMLLDAELAYRIDKEKTAVRDYERAKARYEDATAEMTAASKARVAAKDAVLLAKLPKYPNWYVPTTDEELQDYAELWVREKCVRRVATSVGALGYRLPMEDE